MEQRCNLIVAFKLNLFTKMSQIFVKEKKKREREPLFEFYIVKIHPF